MNEHEKLLVMERVHGGAAWMECERTDTGETGFAATRGGGVAVRRDGAEETTIPAEKFCRDYRLTGRWRDANGGVQPA